MSNETKPETVPYTPPKAAWRLPVFIEASDEAIMASLVDCPTCPVFLLCEAGQGGTGWSCPTCKNTGVYVDEPPEGGQMPKDVLGIECNKHKFHMRKEAEQVTKCALCSGGQMELEVLGKDMTTYVVFTVHATVPALERKKQLKEYFEYWKKYYADQKNNEKKDE